MLCCPCVVQIIIVNTFSVHYLIFNVNLEKCASCGKNTYRGSGWGLTSERLCFIDQIGCNFNIKWSFYNRPLVTPSNGFDKMVNNALWESLAWFSSYTVCNAVPNINLDESIKNTDERWQHCSTCTLLTVPFFLGSWRKMSPSGGGRVRVHMRIWKRSGPTPVR